jgi:hypothetical protein
MKQLSIAATLVLVWMLVALSLDRLLLSQYCSACASVLALELKLKLPAAEITYPPVSLLVLLVIPMLLLAVVLIPWRHARSSRAWRDAFAIWCQPWFWLLFAILLAVVGESLFLATKEYLPKALTSLAEKFTITGTVSVAVKGYKETTPFALTASLSGLIGLVLGSYLFLEKGVNEVFKWPKA